MKRETEKGKRQRQRRQTKTESTKRAENPLNENLGINDETNGECNKEKPPRRKVQIKRGKTSRKTKKETAWAKEKKL